MVSLTCADFRTVSVIVETVTQFITSCRDIDLVYIMFPVFRIDQFQSNPAYQQDGLLGLRL